MAKGHLILEANFKAFIWTLGSQEKMIILICFLIWPILESYTSILGSNENFETYFE